MLSHSQIIEAKTCLPGFERVNRFWDKQRQKTVAKILPGEFYVSRQDELIATTLGSCVSACIWDQQGRIGGMNHFMLPLTKQLSHEVKWGNDHSDATRYGNFAMEHLINGILKHGGLRRNLKAKVFGGGKVMERMSDVGRQNCDFVLEYLHVEKIEIVSQDLGSCYPRKILFDPISGKALVKKLRNLHNNTIVSREKDYQKAINKEKVGGEVELF